MPTAALSPSSPDPGPGPARGSTSGGRGQDARRGEAVWDAAALGRPRAEGHRWWPVRPGRGQQGLLELQPALGEHRKGGTQPGAALVMGVLAIQWGDGPHVVNT